MFIINSIIFFNLPYGNLALYQVWMRKGASEWIVVTLIDDYDENDDDGNGNDDDDDDEDYNDDTNANNSKKC